ncbi:creatininase family protein [Zhouia amylolytica]|uniref:Creatinine amidohydrolase n=1 Tax=Zhouia amylolytica AD3 TaxID=1286632 RepID=W2USI3_9FLAO|nr:creatininase family protein [Zhouia amylolytica]ETN96272.1 creatinine amidohydrolase [Zhouia amylolytica AD3]
MRPFVLAETNWKQVKDQNFEVAILPWGATEAHNYHLPYGTDNMLAESVTIEAASKAWNRGAKPIVLPVVPFGVNTGQLDVSLCINMNPSTQYAVLRDIVQVLHLQKIQKLVIVNAHGGNNFKQMIRELSVEFPDVFVCALNWWHAGNAKAYFDDPGDHAGELETAMILHLFPELVLPLEEAGKGEAKQFAIKALREGWVTTQRKWTSVTKDTGVGNPEKATAAKGAAYFKATSDAIAEFLIDLNDTALNNLYK